MERVLFLAVVRYIKGQHKVGLFHFYALATSSSELSLIEVSLEIR